MNTKTIFKVLSSFLILCCIELQAQSFNPDLEQDLCKELTSLNGQQCKQVLNAIVNPPVSVDRDYIANIVEYFNASMINSKVGVLNTLFKKENGKIILDALVAHGAKFNNRYADGGSLLTDARDLYSQDDQYLELVKFLIDRGVYLNAREPMSGLTELMFASKNSNQALVDLLLEAGANVHILDYSDKTALDYAQNNAIKELLKAHGAVNIDIDKVRSAFSQGDLDQIKGLVNSLFPETDKRGMGEIFRESPMVTASVYGHKQIVEYFITIGLDINARAPSLINPNNPSSFDHERAPLNALETAARFGHMDLVKFFVETHGVPVTDKALFETARYRTQHKNSVQLAEYLYEQGARFVPEMLLLEDCVAEVALFALDKLDEDGFKTDKKLFKKKKIVNVRDNQGNTPFIHFARHKELAVLKMLKEKGAIINAKNEHEKTALDFALEYIKKYNDGRSMDVYSYLISIGAESGNDSDKN